MAVLGNGDLPHCWRTIDAVSFVRFSRHSLRWLRLFVTISSIKWKCPTVLLQSTDFIMTRLALIKQINFVQKGVVWRFRSLSGSQRENYTLCNLMRLTARTTMTTTTTEPGCVRTCRCVFLFWVALRSRYLIDEILQPKSLFVCIICYCQNSFGFLCNVATHRWVL